MRERSLHTSHFILTVVVFLRPARVRAGHEEDCGFRRMECRGSPAHLARDGRRASGIDPALQACSGEEECIALCRTCQTTCGSRRRSPSASRRHFHQHAIDVPLAWRAADCGKTEGGLLQAPGGHCLVWRMEVRHRTPIKRWTERPRRAVRPVCRRNLEPTSARILCS